MCVYLNLGPVADEQRDALLARLAANLSPDMTFSEQFGHPCVWIEGPSDDAASTAVQIRLKAICEELGIPKGEVTTTLDLNRL